jgi:SH3-like domain-containing protein
MKKKNTIVLLTFFFLLAFSLSALAEMAAISGNEVNMRSGPGKKYKVIWKLSNGFPLKILQKKGNWRKVQDFEGTIGWVHKGVVNRKRHMIVKVHKKSRERINVRSSPGTRGKIIAKAYYGVVFETLDQKKGWAKVRHGRKVTGWVKRSLLWGF